MPFYEKGDVRIHYEEAGSGFPLLVIPGGGLNSTVAGLATHPFNPFDEFKGEFRVIAADLRNAKGGQSSGPLEVDRPWDAYTDDHIGLMDHLGICEFMVLGFCIGGPFIWNLLKRAGDRVVAAVPAQPSGYRPEMPDLSYNNNMKDQYVPWRPRRFRVHRDARFRAQLPDPNLGVARRRSRAPVRRCNGDRASRAQRAGEPLSVEGHPGQDSAGGAPHPHLFPRPSTCGSSAIYGRRRSIAPDTSFPASRRARYDGSRASRRAMRQ
jgi:pimeloyl-ACP methyl ester carboxylesterase